MHRTLKNGVGKMKKSILAFCAMLMIMSMAMPAYSDTGCRDWSTDAAEEFLNSERPMWNARWTSCSPTDEANPNSVNEALEQNFYCWNLEEDRNFDAYVSLRMDESQTCQVAEASVYEPAYDHACSANPNCPPTTDDDMRP